MIVRWFPVYIALRYFHHICSFSKCLALYTHTHTLFLAPYLHSGEMCCYPLSLLLYMHSYANKQEPVAFLVSVTPWPSVTHAAKQKIIGIFSSMVVRLSSLSQCSMIFSPILRDSRCTFLAWMYASPWAIMATMNYTEWFIAYSKKVCFSVCCF